MNVFILTQESDESIEKIIGVYSTEGSAQQGIIDYKKERFVYGYDFVIKEVEVQP